MDELNIKKNYLRIIFAIPLFFYIILNLNLNSNLIFILTIIYSSLYLLIILFSDTFIESIIKVGHLFFKLISKYKRRRHKINITDLSDSDLENFSKFVLYIFLLIIMCVLTIICFIFLFNQPISNISTTNSEIIVFCLIWIYSVIYLLYNFCINNPFKSNRTKKSD
jgi:hypothetical protein